MKEKKELELDELENVNGGKDATKLLVECPNCKARFESGDHKVTHGDGCSEESYIKCPMCEHEFK